MAIDIADISEYQGPVNMAAYAAVYPAIIIRLHNGYRPDNLWREHLDGARANVRLIGLYQYVAADRDPEAQADEFCALVSGLRPGEFVVGDFEEGAGDQSDRAQRWLARVDANLGTTAWDYSGESFATTHLAGFFSTDGRPDWVAAYRNSPPTIPHVLWQFTDAKRFPGIAGPCDGSVFDGTSDELAALINPPAATLLPPPLPPTITDYSEDNMRKIEFTVPGLDENGRGYSDLFDVPAGTVESVRVNSAGYTPLPTSPGDEDVDGHARVQWEGQPHATSFGVRVFVTTPPAAG